MKHKIVVNIFSPLKYVHILADTSYIKEDFSDFLYISQENILQIIYID
jgi:hypothetical protein